MKEKLEGRLSGAVERNRTLREEPVGGHLLYIKLLRSPPPPTYSLRTPPPRASHLGLIVLFHSFSPPTPLSHICFCFVIAHSLSMVHLKSYVIRHTFSQSP